MISAWHLAWIVPMAAAFGFLIYSFCKASSREDAFSLADYDSHHIMMK